MTVTNQLREEKHWQGPLPPPMDLQGFGDIDPTFPNRILTMAEKDQDHKIAIANAAAEEQIRINIRAQLQMERGQKFGFVVALSGLAAAAYAISKGEQWAASIIAAVDLVGLVAVFVTGRRQNSEPKQ